MLFNCFSRTDANKYLPNEMSLTPFLSVVIRNSIQSAVALHLLKLINFVQQNNIFI